MSVDPRQLRELLQAYRGTGGNAYLRAKARLFEAVAPALPVLLDAHEERDRLLAVLRDTDEWLAEQGLRSERVEAALGRVRAGAAEARLAAAENERDAFIKFLSTLGYEESDIEDIIAEYLPLWSRLFRGAGWGRVVSVPSGERTLDLDAIDGFLAAATWQAENEAEEFAIRAARELRGEVDILAGEVTQLRQALLGVSNAYGCYAGCTGGLPGAPEGSGHTPACQGARAALVASRPGQEQERRAWDEPSIKSFYIPRSDEGDPSE